MTKIVNLRTARKAKAREEAERQAAANRVLHGRSKARKLADEAERERLARLLDGTRRDD
ncbi:MAG: DUF4169 family protein [Sphingomonadales bacterium]